MKKRILLAIGIVCTLFTISACGNNAPEAFPTETESTEEPATESEEETEPESTEEVVIEDEAETKVEDGEYKIYPSFVTTFELEDNILTIGTEDVFEDFPIPEEMAINFTYPLAEDFEWSDSTSVGSEDDVDWYEWFSFYWEGITMSVDRYLDGQYGDYYTSGEDFCKKNAVWTIVIKDEKVVSISMDVDNTDTEKSETAQESKAESSTKPTDTKESKTNNSSKTAESTPQPTTAPHTHSYVESVISNPTCANEGQKQFVCSCGDSRIESIPRTEHTWREVLGEIYHEAQGEYQQVQIGTSGDVYICAVCNAEFSSASACTDHQLSQTDNIDHMFARTLIRDGGPVYEQQFVEISPAWTETVVTGYQCSVCGATK